MRSDLQFAFRLLAKKPGFTAIAVLTIAVAIGSCTAFFSVMNAVMLRPLDFPEPDSLVRIWARDTERNLDNPVVTWNKWKLYRDEQTVFSRIAISVFNTATITGGTEPEQVATLLASADFFPLLGLRPEQGRAFTADEDKMGAPAVALISHRVWETRFGRDPQVLGRKIILDGIPTDIIGVLPARMPVPFNTPDIIQPRPYEVSFLNAQQRELAGVWQVTARLKPGFSVATAEAQILQLHERFKSANPTNLDSASVPHLRLLRDEVLGNLAATFWVLAGAVGAVLLIGCANIANLSLVRLSARQKEIAVRLSLGASRAAIVRQFLIESAVIAVAGGLLGVLIAAWSIGAIRLVADAQLPRSAEISLDASVLFFGIAVTSITAFLVGIYPAVQATRTDVQTVLKDTSRGAGGGVMGHSFRNALIVAEVTLSLVLLICAGLLIASFGRLQRADLGFSSAGVAVASLNLPQAKYDRPETAREFYRQLQEKLDHAPEIESGGATTILPLSGNAQFTPYAVLGRPIPPVSQRDISGVNVVTPGYFPAMSIRAKSGRLFTEHETALAPGPNGTPSAATGVCVINELLGAKLFPGQSPLGQILLFGLNGEVKSEIVGVVNNVKTAGVSLPAGDEIYFPRAQRGGNFLTVAAKAKPGLKAAAILPVIRRLINEVDPTLALADPSTLDSLIDQSISVQRLMMILLVTFSGIAGLMAAIGIYSVMSHSVAQRTGEIGVRMALGATTRDILQLIFRGAAGLLGVGLTLGLLGAFGASRLLQEILYEVKPFDPVIFVGVAGFFAVVAVVAAIIPARRASRVDPMVALRAG